MYICTVCLCTNERMFVLMYMCVCVYTMHPQLHVANNVVGTVYIPEYILTLSM